MMNRFRLAALVVTFLVLQLIPNPAHAQVWMDVGPEGGPLTDLVVSPSNPATIYVAGLTGGLFRTTNGGDSWRPISAGLCDVHVTAIAVHPSDANTIYVGTTMGGVCGSTDGGMTWTHPGNTGFPVDAAGFPVQVTSLAITPSSSVILNAATASGAYHSSDGGATWTSIAHVASAVDIAAAPSLPSTLYLSGVDDLGNKSVFVSASGGAGWKEVNVTVNQTGLISVDPTNPAIAYLAANVVYRTADRGATWPVYSSGLTGPTQRIVFDPSDPKTVYVTSFNKQEIWRSSQGSVWTQVSTTGLPASLYEFGCLSTIATDPTNAQKMYGAMCTGFYRSSDAGATWTKANAGLMALQATALGLTSEAPASALFVGQHITDLTGPHTGIPGTDVWRIPGGTTTPPTSGFTYNPTTIASGMATDPHDVNTWYMFYPCYDFYRTTDDGTSWQYFQIFAPPGCSGRVTADPIASGLLYAPTSAGLFRSTTGGSSWALLPGSPAVALSVFAISKPQPHVLYAAGQNRMYTSTDGGATWTMTSSSVLPDSAATLSRIAIDPGIDRIAYLATSEGIFRTADGGATWSVQATGWPFINGQIAPAFAIATDPVTPGTVYASPGMAVTGNARFETSPLGTGIYRSTNGGATWALMPGTAGYIVNDIQIDAHRAAFAATNNGVLRLDLTTSVSIDKTSLAFGATTGGAAFASKTPAQIVRLTETGFGGVPWTATSNQPWLTVTPGSGTGFADLTVSVQFVPGLMASQSGTITISAPGASPVQGPITITLNVVGAGGGGGWPFGSFDTPIDLTNGVAGSLAVTGWALDDVAITGVRIMREPVPGEGSGLIFIGNAVQIDGARPDVAAAYPSVPRNTAAGWGYLLLSNFLPNQGNGEVRLHAIADDADGHSVDLGTKTISCANSTSTKPFGAIDTPGQGDVVSGLVPNFGWTLIRNSGTPTPRADIPGGATVTVFVDGVAVGSPEGWTSRADLTALFPSGYSNLNSTLAVYSLDTTTLTNGLHTIFWVGNATNGQSDGIGSRFFSVSNSASLLAADTGQVVRPAVLAGAGHLDHGAGAVAWAEDPVRAPDPVTGRRGFDLAAPYHAYYPEADGVVVVQAEELDRLELLIGASAGWLRTSSGLEPLPTGSHLDPATGTFTWAPGAGFVGAYDLVFARRDARTIVRIVLNPKGSNRVGPQIVIDAPRPDALVPVRFLLGGWAADLDAPSGTGIGTLHVWAYPIAGGDPVFLGVAESGGDRSDVGAIYGEQFRDSGYGLIVDQLPPGSYDLAVFGWDLAKHGFLPAKVVRVTVR